jgi:hypothetical protein
MTKSSIPMNGKKLADRWGIETRDLMYIIFNHNLNVSHPHDGVMSLNETLERFYKDKDTSKYVFSLAEVKAIEIKFGVDGKIPLAEFIRCNDLMTRWEMHDDEIYMIMSDKGLEAIDPFGHEIGNDFLFPLIESGTLDVSDLLFRLTDIKDFESKHPEIIPEQPDPEEDSEPDETEPIPDGEQETIPKICFYKNGDKWLIGAKGEEKVFNHLDGFQYIQFLLRYEGEDFDPIKLFYCGNVPDEFREHLYVKSYQKYGNPETVKEISGFKKELEIKLRKTFKTEDKNALEIQIKQCEDFLKQSRKGFDVKMKGYQVNIQKRIKKAYERIKKNAEEHESLQPLLRYLCLDNPKKRIKTGNFIWYHQDPSDPVKWILDPEG